MASFIRAFAFPLVDHEPLSKPIIAPDQLVTPTLNAVSASNLALQDSAATALAAWKAWNASEYTSGEKSARTALSAAMKHLDTQTQETTK